MDCEEISYVSCIRLGKRPILPPLMTDDRRSEMCYYRDLAVNLEKHKKAKRRSNDSGVIVSSSNGSIGKNVESPKSNDVVNVNEFLTNPADSSMENVDGWETANRERRNSYTLATPSPIMLQYIQTNEKYDELLIDMIDVSDSSTVMNEEVHISIPVEELFDENEKLTLQDLDRKAEPENSPPIKRALRDLNIYSFDSPDATQCAANSQQVKASSLPNTCQSSPVHPVIMSASSCCLKSHYDSVINESETNISKDTASVDNSTENYDSFSVTNASIELPKMKTISDVNEDRLYINDSFSKYVDLLNFSNSMNMSLESDTCRESVCSDCSSVSLSKFFVDMKISDSEDGTLNNYLDVKEQLELKHRNELIKLLREQQKENNLLDQFIRASNASSPKSNYAYSKDVVLKKYSAENSPSPVLSKSTTNSNTIHRLNKTPSCRRRICDDEPRKANITSDGVPVMMTVANLANNKNIQDLEMRIRAATTINAAVRGYFVRRLFKASRVQLLLQTINDCLITAISLQKESDLKPAELSLQSRVLQQSITAQNEILYIFELPTNKKLEIICTDREQKYRSLLRKTRTPLPLSEATQKTIERRKSLNCAPQTQKNIIRKRCRSVSSIGSNSMKCQNTPNKGKTRTKLSQSYSVPRCIRRSWR